MNTNDSPHVVETSGLTKQFGERTVVRDVELHVPRGSAFGYLGPNGAGKTTLIRMLLGLTSATAGSMKLRGLEVPARRSEALSRVGAIVDRGQIVVQGSIAELRNGGEHGVVVDVDDVPRASMLLAAHPAVIRVENDGDDSVRVALRDATAVADLNRRLVQAGISVNRLDPAQPSLEQRFLEITTRLEDAA